MKKDAQQLFQLAVKALERAGANSRMAEAAARHLVAAEEQGLPTHGMSRVPFYCGMLKRGRADGAAQPAMVTERGAVCLLDNRDGLPYVTAQWAVDDVIQRARRNGIAFCGIRNSAHVGVMGIHLQPVAQAQLIRRPPSKILPNTTPTSPPFSNKIRMRKSAHWKHSLLSTRTA